jgi:aminoglycoside phosphotransferase (APT) family kinase protein
VSTGDEAHGRFLVSRPRREGLRAVVDAVEPGADVARVRRLKGGLEAATHRVDLVTPSGARRSVVLRRFNDSFRWYDPERLPREVALLRSLAPTEVPAPEVVAVDAEGAWFGSPALVLTFLPGGPAPFTRWVPWSRPLVEAMAVVHAVEPVVDAEPWLTGWARDEPPESLVDDPWVARVWPSIRSSVGELTAGGDAALVHHDLHPGNALWRRGRLTGIVDWPMAGRGFAAYDRAYLRLDVSLCLGLAAGDAVAGWFGEVEGSRARVDSPAWDLVVGLRALPDPDLWVSVYRSLGAPVTEAEGRSRLAAWFERALAALG